MALTKVSTGMLSADVASIDLNIDANTMYIDVSNNRVGINNAAPSTALDVTGSVTADGLTVGDTSASQSLIQMLANPTNGANTIHFGDGASADAYVGYINYAHASNSMQFAAGGSTRVTIDGATGNVGIGVVPSADSFFKSLEIGNTGSGITGRGAADTHFMSGLIWDGTSTQEYTVSSVAVGKYQITNGIHSWATAPAGTAGFVATPQTNMTLDTSGSLLVGKSANDNTTAGHRFTASGFTSHVIANDYPLLLNRLSSDGALLTLRKDSVTVGSIGTNGGRLSIGSGDVNLNFNASANSIYPISDTAGTLSDGIVDVGASSARFKDLHLSESVKLSANDGGGLGSNSIDFAHTGHTAGPSAQIHVDYTGDFRANLLFKINKAQSNSAPTEVARFTNGGNLLVGKTAVSGSTVGAEIRAVGSVLAVRDGDYAGYFNRKTSDGEIVRFVKDTTTVGSIGTLDGNSIYIGNGEVNLRMIGVTNDIRPVTSSGTNRDAAVDLGAANARFKDLHLSGEIYNTAAYNQTTALAANMYVNSGGRFFRSTSSERYKNTIQDATHGLTELLTLRPVTYKGNDDGDLVFGGLIAEEVHDAGLTEFVQYNEENQPDALAYGNMVSLCIKAIQEQQATIEALTARIAALES